MQAREADDGDAEALHGFRSASTAEPHDVEVEQYVRSGLLWKADDSSRRLKVFEDDTGSIVAVAGYEPLAPHDRSRGFWFSFLALTVAAQGKGVGMEIFDALVRHLGAEAPGAPLGWRVHVRNRASQRMCEKLGFGDDWISDPEAPGYLTYGISLPE